MTSITKTVAAFLAAKTAFDFVKERKGYNRLKAPAGNFGVPRLHMPQIDGNVIEDFKRSMASRGLKMELAKVNVASLKLYQNEYNKDKVLSLMASMQKSMAAAWRPIIISKDGYVLDGSHRFLAAYNMDRGPGFQIPCLIVPLPALEALNAVRLFAGARYRGVSGKEISK